MDKNIEDQIILLAKMSDDLLLNTVNALEQFYNQSFPKYVIGSNKKLYAEKIMKRLMEIVNSNTRSENLNLISKAMDKVYSLNPGFADDIINKAKKKWNLFNIFRRSN